MQKLLTINELAEKLNVPVSWIYARTQINSEDSIPVIRVGRLLRFNETEIEEWLEAQKVVK